MRKLKMRFVDLAVPIQNPNPGEIREELKDGLTGTIEYLDHIQGALQMMDVFNCKKEDLPEGYGWANEYIKLTTHTGTHMDAPYHYYPTTAGKPARTIDELPLDWFYGDGVVLDLRHKKSGETASVEDVKGALEKANYTLKAGDIVCLMFGCDANLGEPSYWSEFPGMSAEATHWIVDQGIKVIGTDAMGFDIPFEKIRSNFEETQKKEGIWEAHRVGIHKEYCQIEKMANLTQLPLHGFKIACFPIPIHKASAGWVRPVAIIPS